MARVNAGNVDDVDKAVAAAKFAFEKGFDGHQAWKDTDGKQRNAYLVKLADLVEKNLEELSYLDNISMGGPDAFNQNAPTFLRYAGGWAERIVSDTLLGSSRTEKWYSTSISANPSLTLFLASADWNDSRSRDSTRWKYCL